MKNMKKTIIGLCIFLFVISISAIASSSIDNTTNTTPQENEVTITENSNSGFQQSFEMFKLVLPIITFLLGYLASNFDKYRESKRKLRNMKSILFKELGENYKILNGLIPKEGFPQNPIPVANQSQKLSFSVYDAYIDRIDALKSEEVDKIYDAFSSQKETYKQGEIFLDEPEHRHVWSL